MINVYLLLDYPYRKESVFPLLSGKGLGLPAFCRKAALKGLAGRKKSSSLRSGIFSCQALRKKAIQEAGGL
ncbi:MAG: hypothetical protein KH057_14265 [Bacteroides sp.]|nr:hypothetical protein [Bacteroides sp.]